MEIRICTLGGRAPKKAAFEELVAAYCARIGHSAACSREHHGAEDRFFAALDRMPGRAGSARQPGTRVVLLDARGSPFTSEEFAAWLLRQRDGGTQRLVFAVGPADGWSTAARAGAGLLLSLGPMTLPHELAAVVQDEHV